MEEAAVLRRELSRLETGRGRKYPQELRARMVAWALRRHRDGASWEDIKQEPGWSGTAFDAGVRTEG
jgi:hypothetical protein